MNPSTRVGVAAWAAGVLLLGGCAMETTPAKRTDWRHYGQARETRERTMQQDWVGRSQQELVAQFGSPSTVMGVPGDRLPNSVILVYRNQDPVGGCTDAFVVLTDGSRQVWNYFCR